MKRDIVLVGLVVGLALVMGMQDTESGDPIRSYQLCTPKSSWRNLDSDGISASQSLPGVGDWDYTTVSALAATKTVTFDVPSDWNGAMFRIEGQTNNHNNVVEVLASAGQYQRDGTTDDDFFYAGQLDCTVGQQTGSNSNLYVDTVSVTDGILDFTAHDSGNDRQCVVKVDLQGVRKLVFICSTLNSDAVYIHARKW